MNTTLKCPTCQKPIIWDPKNKFRPFCSERCKLIDLGAWADGSYSIPSSPPLDSEEHDLDLPENEDPEKPSEPE